MISALQEAVSIAAQLSESEQNQIAAKIREAIESIDDSARWQQQFADSKDVLKMLHDEGLREYQSGQTQPLEK